MFARFRLRPASLVALSVLSRPSYAIAEGSSSDGPSPPLSHIRRERAARVLTIAAAVEPQETATALRLARDTIREQHFSSLTAREQTFLRYTLKDGVARGVACAAGGAAASYAILKIVLLVIPLVPSKLVSRAAMSAVSFGAAVVELAAFPDITTIELLLMNNSSLGCKARKRIEEYNPHLLLLQTLDRQAEHAEYRVQADTDLFEFESLKHPKSEFFDQEVHVR